MTSKKPASKTHQLGNTAPLCNATPPPVASELARAGPRSGPRPGDGCFQLNWHCVFGAAAQPSASKLARHKKGVLTCDRTDPASGVTGRAWRGDDRHPEEIFEIGFESRGTSTDLYLHSQNNMNPPSNFVSTSTSRDEGITFGTTFGLEEGYLYTLKKIAGRDVNKELGKLSDFQREREIAIPKRIDTKDILGATPLNEDGTDKGYSLINPNRK